MTLARAAVVGLAAFCLLVVGLLAWGAMRSADSAAVGELPTVAEIVAAEAHMHGVRLPELSDEDRVRLSAAPTAASTLSPFDQVRVQLEAVKEAGGLDEALAILADVALQSPEVASDCARIFDSLVAGGSSSSMTVAQVCPR